MKKLLFITAILLFGCDYVEPCNIACRTDYAPGFKWVDGEKSRDISHCIPCNQARDPQEIKACIGYINPPVQKPSKDF